MCGGFGIERTRMSRSMGRGRAWDGVWEALHMLREMGCMLIMQEMAVNFVVRRDGTRRYFINYCMECRPLDLEVEEVP